MNGFGYDPELPRGCQDADIEMADMIARAKEAEIAWKKHRICDHPHSGPCREFEEFVEWENDKSPNKGNYQGRLKCFQCGKVWANGHERYGSRGLAQPSAHDQNQYR